jgi:hypothetical protein
VKRNVSYQIPEKMVDFVSQNMKPDRRFTTEAQSTQRMLFFPWPGEDGQGKEPPPVAEALEPGSNP